jgi:protein transport protein SEC61 subunit alpha
MSRIIDIFEPLRPWVPVVLPANKEIDKDAQALGRVAYREKSVRAGMAAAAQAPLPMRALTPPPPSPTSLSNHPQLPTQRDKFFWSAMVLLLYLVASQVPLYGMLVKSGGHYTMRMMMASKRATLMELGVFPIMISYRFLLLARARILDADLKKKEDRNLVNVAETTLGVLISLGSALTFVLGGQYGPVAVLGAVRCTLLVLQLFFAGTVVVLLDDLLCSGYGLDSGLNLFVVANIAWACLSPLTITAGSASSTQYEGALTHVLYMLSKDFSAKALWDAATRSEHPNMLHVVATSVIFAGIAYLQRWAMSCIIEPKRGSKRAAKHSD